MSIITQDALQIISEHLSPTSRLNLAVIDQRFFDIATRWNDVKTIVFDDDDVTLAGANFVHNYNCDVFEKKNAAGNDRSFYKTEAKETALKLCPAVKKLIIQTKLSDFDAIMLDKMNLKLTKLYMSIENLSLVNFPKFPRLRTLHLVANSTKELGVLDVVESRALKAIFPQTLTRVCLTGIFLTENLLLHLIALENLVVLDMIGCLVDTRVGAKYVPLLEKFPSLEDLSLPPSLFSFSTKPSTQTEFTLQKLNVVKLGLYMDQFDEDTFYSQTLKFLPRKLEILVVFGNYMPLKKWKMLKTNKKFQIVFGPNISLASCPQANLSNVKLLSHLIRSPPYTIQEYNPNFHRNHDIPLGNFSWQFSLIEWQGAGTRKELISIRRRLNALEGEEVMLEGIRIPPPVIENRVRQLRDNRLPGSPEFEVFDPLAPILPLARVLPRLPLRRPGQERGVLRREGSARNRRNRSAPPSIVRPLAIPPPPPPPTQSDSMRTHPPSPPATLTGAVLNNTLQSISPIITNTTASRLGGSTTSSDVMNRAFLGTPAFEESRRLSTASQNSTIVNSEITVATTATASPERLSAQAPRNFTPPPNNNVPTSANSNESVASNPPVNPEAHGAHNLN
ncbi:unnamed protein product [Caenorhabditis sp. 36 PRJEB53466]|nr:unnamed protein product [Caenorhabditis sp. 36 PRJEB53466]